MDGTRPFGAIVILMIGVRSGSPPKRRQAIALSRPGSPAVQIIS